MKKWYPKNTSGGQALIIKEDNGKNVAVAYDADDGPLLAAAPEMLSLLKQALPWMAKIKADETHNGCVLPSGFKRTYRAMNELLNHQI